MRRRLTVAMLGLLVGTLVLTVAGSLLLVRRAGLSSAETDLTGQLQALAQLLATRSAVVTDRVALDLLRRAGSDDALVLVGLGPTGAFTSLPSPLTPADLDVPALQADRSVTGNVGTEVFAAEPVSLTANQRRRLGPVPAGDLPVLLVTRRVHPPLNGLLYFLLVAGAVLALGAVVAAALAARITSPLGRAVDTTRRMAAGDLDARVDVAQGDYPELAQLAGAINALGDALGRARGMERQFLLSVSHDLRTPLTSIRGYAEALADGAATDVTGAALVIAGEARRLERLVGDLLDLARLDARRFSLDMQPVEVTRLVREAADAFRPQAASLGLEVDAVVDDGRPLWVRADPDRLAQALSNLVENGIKFTGAKVALTARAEGPSCRIEVTDDGPGIPAADAGRVFDRHFTTERARGRQVGTGLGLAIVAELAHAMGGTVEARSPVFATGGTRVVLVLPLVSP